MILEEPYYYIPKYIIPENNIIDNISCDFKVIVLNSTLKNELLKIINNCINYKILKIGLNQVTNLLNNNKLLLVILASDVDNITLLANVVSLCKKNNVKYFFVDSKKELGNACGIKKNNVCCGILKTDSSYINHIKNFIIKLDIRNYA